MSLIELNLIVHVVETNKKYLTTDPKVMEVLDGITGSANWYKQVLDHNKGNKTQIDFINKVGRIALPGCK